MKLLTWIFAIIGVLGLFDWMFAKSLLEIDPSNNKLAQVFSAPWVLYVSLVFMTLGLLFAWVSGHDVNDETSITKRGQQR